MEPEVISDVFEAAVVKPEEEEEGAGVDSSKVTENISKMLMIAICYSGNIGGTSSLIGTTPNILAYDIWQEWVFEIC